MDAHLSTEIVEAVATAIFEQPQPTVVEAYSVPGAKPRAFRSPAELIQYVRAQRMAPDGSAHFAVHYPDMAGTVLQSKVYLEPTPGNGHSYRYMTEGWGLLWVMLRWWPGPLGSFISANSRKRAMAWASTHPEWGSPNEWEWVAVRRHLRRLRRVLKMAA